MWTPKRVLLLLAGFSLFAASFLVYAFFLGGIDGLPPLPAGCLPNSHDSLTSAHKESMADQKLREAFGEKCPELERPIRVDVRSRGLVIATGQFNIIETDKHKVELVPFSAALFGKPAKEGDFPEINTIKGDRAFLIFDRPIENITEIGDRKIVGAELYGREIQLNNNRRTPGKSDDIDVRIVKGPLKYDEGKSLIWSPGWVDLTETQPHAKPIMVHAHGLEVFLTKETPPAGAKAAKDGLSAKKAAGRTVSGVEKVNLLGDVRMIFPVDPKSGFLGAPAPAPRAADAAPAPKKPSLIPDQLLPAPEAKPEVAQDSTVVITTDGPFTYEVEKDWAKFTSPEPSATGEKLGFPSQFVHVVRTRPKEGDGELDDQLDCDFLELQFCKKTEGELPGADPGQGDREIETAWATVRKGKGNIDGTNPNEERQVVAVLGAENLHAYCDELIYHRATAERGPETILRGRPMRALKDDHEIKAVEVQLIGNNKNGEGQYAHAKGPGELNLIDHGKIDDKPRAQTVPVAQYHARWKDSLVVTKDKEKGRLYDLLTFTGDAVFIDDAHDQKLHGSKLMVWLEQAERFESEQPDRPQKDKADDGPRQQPHRLEAFEQVWVRSPDLNVDDSDYLIVNFKNDVEARVPGELPAPADNAAKAPAGDNGGKSPSADVTGKSPASAPAAAGTDPDKKASRPINLTAKRVRAEVLRTAAKNELKEVFTDGNVHVTQEAAKPGEKGVDITGDELKLYHYPDAGDILIVFGSPGKNAKLMLGDTTLVGPEVRIDQQLNTVAVKDAGVMHMPTSSNLDGTKNTKPNLMLTVVWQKDMLFDGKIASFHGKVSAHQEESKLLCDTLDVYLDKTVSLKEGDKQGQGAKVERLVCSKSVNVEDKKQDDWNQFLRQDRMICSQLTTDNQDDHTDGWGPGQLDSKQLGNGDVQNNNNQAKEQMYVTRVNYQGKFWSKRYKDGTRLSKFWGGVEVLHFPSEDINAPMTPEKLPKGGMFLKSDYLEVYSRPGPDGKMVQEMLAKENVFFQNNDVRGKAPRMHYNQETEHLTLSGTVGNRAYIQRLTPTNPASAQELMATDILYNRKTGLFSSSGVPAIQGFAK